MAALPPSSPLASISESADMVLDNEPFQSLNWPDSADLLSAILNAEFAALPTLETLPSLSLVQGSQEVDFQPVSPWLTADSADNQNILHGGNNAVQNLSQIIETLVWEVFPRT